MVSRSWYFAAIPALYHSPFLSGKNFNLFVRTICPSINAHIRKTKFSSMIKILNMSYLVHDSSRSLTARILTRLKDGLEVFIAPQTSFAVNCLAAISKCYHLRELNLIRATESLSLQSLSMRCKEVPAAPNSDAVWPPHLKSLQVSGSFTNRTLDYFYTLPKTLTSFAIHDASTFDCEALIALLDVIGHRLESLHLGSGPAGYEYVTLSDWLRLLPNLQRLHIRLSASQIGHSLNIFDGRRRIYDSQNPHPLTQLKLVGFDLPIVQGVFDLVADGYLGCLRQVIIFRKTYFGTFSKHDKQNVHELDDLLRALAREGGAGASIDEEHAGAKVVQL
ncbi:MAG: hypothetical protein Q9193_003157 [Seirophora villosa]